MQLLLRRRILTPTAKFALWGKFDVSEEEQRLIRRYMVSRLRHRGGIYGGLWSSRFFIALIGVSLLSAAFSYLPTTMAQTQRGMVGQPLSFPWIVWAILFAIVFSIATFLIYEQLRIAIRIQDMLDGREFKNKSLVLMARRERQLIGYAHAFVQLLEKLQNWEGTDIIEIGENTEPALRLVTDAYNAAA
jgi:hypothetical protein